MGSGRTLRLTGILCDVAQAQEGSDSIRGRRGIQKPICDVFVGFTGQQKEVPQESSTRRAIPQAAELVESNLLVPVDGLDTEDAVFAERAEP